MNSNPHSSAKRKRGIALTASGLRRLNQAIQSAEAIENEGRRFTAEELSQRCGISTSTLSRLWASRSGVDRRTLHLLFSAFKLDLLDSDLQQCPEDTEVPPSQPWIESTSNSLSIPYPSGPVPIGSEYYIRRPEVDDRALQEILQPGCVIRIKAPSGFGKTSLLLRLLHQAKQHGYNTVAIDLQQADTETLSQSHAFLRWFCVVLCRKLERETSVDQYWDDLLGSKLSTTLYVREAILSGLDRPLVLVLNEVERVFEHPETARSLLPLLRSWHEEAQHDEVWKQLRLVVAYSTDAYLPLDINQSPFNVGLPLTLPPFTRAQVEAIAQAYAVIWNEAVCDRLLDLLGGNPTLINLALYHLHQGMSADELLRSVASSEGIYRNHLQRLLTQINTNPQWVEQIQSLVCHDAMNSADERPQIRLDPILAYKLEGLGLIQPTPNGWQLSCKLYQEYFQTYLFTP